MLAFLYTRPSCINLRKPSLLNNGIYSSNKSARNWSIAIFTTSLGVFATLPVLAAPDSKEARKESKRKYTYLFKTIRNLFVIWNDLTVSHYISAAKIMPKVRQEVTPIGFQKNKAQALSRLAISQKPKNYNIFYYTASLLHDIPKIKELD